MARQVYREERNQVQAWQGLIGLVHRGHQYQVSVQVQEQEEEEAASSQEEVPQGSQFILIKQHFWFKFRVRLRQPWLQARVKRPLQT